MALLTRDASVENQWNMGSVYHVHRSIWDLRGPSVILPIGSASAYPTPNARHEVSDNHDYLDFVHSRSVAEGIAQAVYHVCSEFLHVVDLR